MSVSEEAPVTKKTKLDENTEKEKEKTEDPLDELKDLNDFVFERVLREDSDRRLIIVQGHFPKSKAPEAIAIVILEKTVLILLKNDSVSVGVGDLLKKS